MNMGSNPNRNSRNRPDSERIHPLLSGHLLEADVFS